jgi:hypothetical protein
MITNEQLQAVLGSRTISYKAIFAKAIGNVNAAVFLSQGLFWQEEAKYKTNVIIEGKKFFAKTIPEWWDETGLTEDQQRTARAALLRKP